MPEYQDTYAYVFKPMSKRRTVIGLGAKEWGVTVLCTAMGALLAFVLGGWTQPTEVAVPQTEISSQVAELKDERAACQRLEEKAQAMAANQKTAETSQSDQELLKKAAEHGVAADSTNEELEDMVDKTEVEDMPVIPDVPRWMSLVFGPLIFSAAIQAEFFRNSSILKESKRAISNWADQHEFRSRPKEYMSKNEPEVRA